MDYLVSLRDILTIPVALVCLTGPLAVLAEPAAVSDPLAEARALQVAGRSREALEAYRTLVAESDVPAVLAIARNNACVVLNELGEYPAALEECRAALGLRRELDDERGLGRTLNNTALALRHLGSYDQAASSYREALAINERRDDVAAQVLNRLNLGALMASAGHFTEAMRLYAIAEALAIEHRDEPWAGRQRRIARINQGITLERLGAFREALDLYRDVVSEKDQMPPGLRASVEVNLGVIYRNLGDPLRAVAAFEEAAATYTRLGNDAALSNTKLNLALALHLNLGRAEDAEVVYREALALARSSGDRLEEIQVLFYLANLELEFGRSKEARELFERCLFLARASGSAEGRWSALDGLGRIALKNGEARRALARFLEALAEIESVRSSLTEPALRSGYFGDKRPIYAAAIRVLATLEREEPGGGHGARALELVQRAKARELLDSLGRGRHGEPAAGAVPLVAAMLPGLAGSSVVLEYFRGEEDLYLWVLSGEGIRMVELGPARPILDRVMALYRTLSSGREPSPGILTGLSQALLGDEFLAEAESLRIAPDGELFYLPFEILDDPGSPGSALLDRLTVSYLPSASALALLNRSRSGEMGIDLVGFADPELPIDPENAHAPANLLIARFGFARLPAAAGELAKVARFLPGEHELRTGREATEEAFRRAVVRGARVVHLATHTLVDERPGRGAAVLLAASEEHDGILYPEEISTLDYRVGLTVLASCRSALGEIESGRALASLTGSFLAAGSSAVLATLWDVDDGDAAVFMEQFYHQLGRGHSAAEALRRAKIRLRSNPAWNRMGVWSAYVLTGDVASIVDRRQVPAWAWVVVAILLLLRGMLPGRSSLKKR